MAAQAATAIWQFYGSLNAAFTVVAGTAFGAICVGCGPVFLVAGNIVPRA